MEKPCGAFVVRMGFRGGNVAHAGKHQPGPEGELLKILPTGHAGKHQSGVHAGFDAGNHVGVHPVTDDHGILRVNAQQPQAGAHHQGVGLAHKIGSLAGGGLNGSHQTAAGGDHSILGRIHQIAVGGHQLGAPVHKVDGLHNVFVAVVFGFAHNHEFRIHGVDGDACVIQSVHQPVVADHIGAAVR